MARPGRPERNRAARSFRQLRRFHHVINSDKVFGTHNRDRKPGGERNQENAGAEARRKYEKCERQPGRRRQRPDEPQNRVDPITGEPRPADRHASHEPDRRTEKITGREQTSRGQDARSQPPPVVDYDFDNGLRRRKKRQRKQSELCGDGLPSSQKQRERDQPRRKPLETLENSKTN